MAVFGVIRTGYRTVKVVKNGIAVVRHPIQWAKGQLIGAIKTMLLVAMGEKVAKEVVARLDLEGKTFPLQLSIPLHSRLQSVVGNPEHIDFVEEVINDALMIPLEALGYKLAQVEFLFQTETGTLELRAQVGLQHRDAAMAPRAPLAIEVEQPEVVVIETTTVQLLDVVPSLSEAKSPPANG